MKQGNLISKILFFILFFFVQIIFFRDVVLFGYASCFIYVGYILIFPIDVKPVHLMLIAFAFGLAMDTFYDTVGINAFACVLISYMRPYILKILTPPGGYDNLTEISISSLGIVWFVKYAAVLIFIHHFTFFTLEAWDMKYFVAIFLRAISSVIFTFLTITLLQYLVKTTSR